MTISSYEFSTTGLSMYDPTGPSWFTNINDQLILWLGEICDPVLGAITNTGSGYVDGVYPNVELRRTASTQFGGNHLLATVTISGGGISDVVITQKGNGFKTGDEITIPNLAQIGGSGSGFTMDIASANAEIGFIYDTYRGSGTGYDRGFVIGYERLNTYTMGTFIYKSSDTSTLYLLDFFNITPSTSNNSYGTPSSQNSVQSNTWRTTTGGGYTAKIVWSSEPDDLYFLYTDTIYGSPWGMMRLNRPAGKSYPDKENALSPWGSIYQSAHRPSGRVNYSNDYFGCGSHTNPVLPQDAGVLFTEQPKFSKAFHVGDTPPGIGFSESTAFVLNSQYQDGIEVFDQMGTTTWARSSK